MEIKIINKSKHDLPYYATMGASGLDLKSNIEEPVVIKPLQRVLIGTGLYIAIPQNYEAQIRPRSGLALNFGITVLNSPGTIDSDYRGELKVLLINLSDKDFTVNNGDRIAQLIVAPFAKISWLISNNLDDTERRCGGYGSTGV